MSEAPVPPAATAADGRLGASKKPRQVQPHWWDFLAALPSQVRRPLRDALNSRVSNARRRAGLHHASCELEGFRRAAATYSGSVDTMLDRRGLEYVHPANPAEASEFVDRITPSGLNALSKRKRAEAAIAYADMAIEWVEWELGHGD